MNTTALVAVCILVVVAITALFIAHANTLHRRLEVVERDSHTHSDPSGSLHVSLEADASPFTGTLDQGDIATSNLLIAKPLGRHVLGAISATETILELSNRGLPIRTGTDCDFHAHSLFSKCHNGLTITQYLDLATEFQLDADSDDLQLSVPDLIPPRPASTHVNALRTEQ